MVILLLCKSQALGGEEARKRTGRCNSEKCEENGQLYRMRILLCKLESKSLLGVKVLSAGSSHFL